jgi:hypothetical protein
VLIYTDHTGSADGRLLLPPLLARLEALAAATAIDHDDLVSVLIDLGIAKVFDAGTTDESSRPTPGGREKPPRAPPRARAAVRVQGCGVADSATVAAYPSCAGDNRLAVPLGDPKVTWATYRVGQYTIPWSNQADARNAVRLERRLELAMEGQRFFDLRRWQIADQVLNAYVAVEETRRLYKAATATFVARHMLYPIPPIQIELSKVEGQPRLTQNPGW